MTPEGDPNTFTRTICGCEADEINEIVYSRRSKMISAESLKLVARI